MHMDATNAANFARIDFLLLLLISKYILDHVTMLLYYVSACFAIHFVTLDELHKCGGANRQRTSKIARLLKNEAKHAFEFL